MSGERESLLGQMRARGALQDAFDEVLVHFIEHPQCPHAHTLMRLWLALTRSSRGAMSQSVRTALALPEVPRGLAIRLLRQYCALEAERRTELTGMACAVAQVYPELAALRQ